MEMIAASKMRRAQEQARASRPYADKMVQVLSDLAAQPATGGVLHPLLASREVRAVEIIYISTDRGLCGGLNANLSRQTASFILEQRSPLRGVAVGRKGRDFVLRSGVKLAGEFTGLGDRPSLLDTIPISRIVIDDYTSQQADVVYLSYTHFVNTIVQKPVLKKLLPVEPAVLQRIENVEYIYEPSPALVLAELLPRFVELEVYQAILESIASEQSARMVAMRSATDNANEFIQQLTLSYNKARQETITKELLDIVGGAANIGTKR